MEGELKINFDGGVAGGVTSCGFVIRNEREAVMCAGHSRVKSTNVVDDEVHGRALGGDYDNGKGIS